MLAVVLAALLGVQDPEPRPPDPATPPAAPVSPEAPATQPVEDWDDARVKDELKAFNERIKSRALKDRIAAVERLAVGRNAKLVPPLANTVARDPALTVRKTAALGLAHQPPREAKPAVVRLLGGDLDAVPEVQAVLVTTLSRVGYEKKRDWEPIKNLFERDYGENRLALQRAILALIEEHQELEAIDMLVRNLGEPVPENVDDASNPPAEYWERRWKAWQSWRADVKEALLAVTGQQFSTPKEAKDWLRENRAKLERRKQDKPAKPVKK
ncbi:MAG: HEAT repeat domain-containing protein [Planctomycetes bacterium]|nr:HEAT repeat domain-containing protein [Planctomycetota bacterium]